MPTSYEFITFSDPSRMRNASTKSQIRKHAMKDIGASRRRWLGPPTELTLEINPIAERSMPAMQPDSEDHLPLTDNRALYNPDIRALSCQLDPFGTASIRVDATAHGLLRYFVYYSSNFPNNFTFTPRICDTVESAFQDELLMHCILSAAAPRVHYVQSLQFPPYKKTELLSTQQAVTLLQTRLQESLEHSANSTERLVNCMLYLGAGAIYRDDIQAAKIHVNAAIRLAEHMGGVTKLQDSQILVRAISLDDLLACNDLIPCTVKCTYDPGPLCFSSRTQMTQTFQLDVLPDGFVTTDYNILPTSLRGLVLQVLECHRAKCYLEKSGSCLSSEITTQRYRLKLRTLATRNSLLGFATDQDRTDAVRIALILCTLLPPCDMRQVKTAQTIAQRLKSILVQSLIAGWEGAEHTRFWCLLVGYFSAGKEEGIRDWFAKMIYKTVLMEGSIIGIHIGPRILADLFAFQTGFLFDEVEVRQHTENLVWSIANLNEQ